MSATDLFPTKRRLHLSCLPRMALLPPELKPTQNASSFSSANPDAIHKKDETADKTEWMICIINFKIRCPLALMPK